MACGASRSASCGGCLVGCRDFMSDTLFFVALFCMGVLYIWVMNCVIIQRIDEQFKKLREDLKNKKL